MKNFQLDSLDGQRAFVKHCIEENFVSDKNFFNLRFYAQNILNLVKKPSRKDENSVHGIAYRATNDIFNITYAKTIDNFVFNPISILLTSDGLKNYIQLCNDLKITPNYIIDDVTKSLYCCNFNNSVDALKVALYFDENFVQKNHKYAAAPLQDKFNGKTLNSDSDILQPSDEAIKPYYDAVYGMSRGQRTALERQINLLDLRRIFPPDKNGDGFICPVCGNGSGHKGDGIKPSRATSTDKNGDTHEYYFQHCFSKGDFEGTLTCIISRFNYERFSPLENEQKYLYVLAIGKFLLDKASDYKHALPPIRTISNKEVDAATLSLIRADITDAQKHIEDLPLDDRRGLTIETLKHFGVGYSANWTHTKNRLEEKFFTPSPRLIIPTSDKSYNAILLKSARTDANKKWKSMNAGTKEIFNSAAIVPNKIVIAVEGEFDAMSIFQATGGNVNVIALGGAGQSNLKNFLQANIPTNERKNYSFVILFDNDKSGIDKSAELTEDLRRLGYPTVKKFLDEGANKVDANDILTNEGDAALNSRVEQIISAAQIELDDVKEKLVNNPIIDDVPTYDVAKLNADLQSKFDSLEKEKIAAIEYLKNLETFDSNTIFNNDTINAAAFAKLYDSTVYQRFMHDVKLYSDKHRSEKVNSVELKSMITIAADSISAREKLLLTQKAKIHGTIKTKKFLADNKDLQNISLPTDYFISLDEGVTKIINDKGKTINVSKCPVIIAGKTKSVDENKFKLILQLWTREGKRRILPPYPASTIFNAKKIVDVADFGLSVSTLDAALLTDYLNAFNVENESFIPQTCTVPRCGWHTINDKDIFVDPRIVSTITDDGITYPLVADSQSNFAKTLIAHGTLENWKKAYDLAKPSLVARFIVAAAVAPPLLKILGERNFLLYIYTKTRAGKTTALHLGASAVGNKKMIRSFDSTKNGLIGAAADVNDYAFLVDEKQVADNRIAEQFTLIVYALANGIGRLKLNKDSTVRDTADWRTIPIMTGETPLLKDSSIGGAFTRILQVLAPKVILDADTCKQIRDIIADNYGVVFPLVISKILKLGNDFLRNCFNDFLARFKTFDSILDEYRRYIAVISLADMVLNMILCVDTKTAFSDAVKNAYNVFDLIQSKDDIDDTQRELDAILGFIAQNQSRFIGGNIEVEKMQKFYGKIEEDYFFITVAAMKEACTISKFDYDKVIADLLDAKILIPSDKIKKGHKKPLNVHVKKLGTTAANCYKLIRQQNYTPTTPTNFDDDFEGEPIPDWKIPDSVKN